MVIVQNDSNGLFRASLCLKDRKTKRAIIIEAKRSDKASDMDRDCDKAIKQIVDEKYAEDIPGYGRILCYGIAFYQKQAMVKLLR